MNPLTWLVVFVIHQIVFWELVSGSPLWVSIPFRAALYAGIIYFSDKVWAQMKRGGDK